MSAEQEIKPGRGGFRTGAGRPKGSKSSRSKTQQEKDTLAALRIEQLLDDAREGKIALDQSKLKAIEIRYSRLRPVLSAVEQTTVDPREQQDPAELESKLRALHDARPELFAFLQPKPAASTQQEAPAQTTRQVTH